MKKLEVSSFQPPEEIAEVAERRCIDIYRSWAWSPRSNIKTLIVSLYLQGMTDAIETMANQQPQ